MAKSKLNLHKAKFFCENCGAEVPQNAKFCSTCGKFFTFVRCPNCQYTGDAKIFTNGCPECGYAVKNKMGMSSGKSSGEASSAPSFFGNPFSEKSGNRSNSGDSSLPLWMYIATALVLIAVIFGVWSCL